MRKVLRSQPFTSKLPNFRSQRTVSHITYQYKYYFPAVTNGTTKSPAAIAEAEQLRKQYLKERVKRWGNVELRLVPELPTKPPNFLECYVDTKNPIYAPLVHVCTSGSGGSMHRVGFILAVNRILKVPDKYVNHIVEIGQCLHNLSLIVDDICDDTTQRRGEPAAHVKFGLAPALLSAYTTLFNILLSVDVYLGSVPVALEECARMHHTNAVEVYWRDSLREPTETEYMDMVDGKTGGAFRVVTRLLLDLSPPVPEWLCEVLLAITDDVGRFFQIRDDYLDIVSEEFAKKKGGYGSDFKEGKFSFPVVHCTRTHPETLEKFLEVFRKPSDKTTEEDVERLTKILKETGSLEYTVKILESLACRILGACALLKEQGYDATTMISWFQNLASGIDDFTLPAPNAANCAYKLSLDRSETNAQAAASVQQLKAQEVVKPTSVESSKVNLSANKKTAAELGLLQKLCIQVLELDLMTNLSEIDRVIRQVLACYEVYFSENGLTHRDFWICFPWFLLLKGGIKASAEKGQSLIIRRLIKSSPFVDEQFFAMFQKAVDYYYSKQLWIKGKRTKLTPVEMCECKPTNFRIMRWLVHRWYRPTTPNSGNAKMEGEKMALENYLAIVNAEQRLPYDKNGTHYNIILHFRSHYGAEEGQKLLEQYKASLYAKLCEGGLKDVAQRWTTVLQDCSVEMAGSADVRIGARDILKAGFTVARACMEDVELASSTLGGNWGWMRSHFRPTTLDSMFADFMHQIQHIRTN